MTDTATQLQTGSYRLPSFDHATVADAMHVGIFSCDAKTTPREAARTMSTRHIHCLVVGGLAHDRAGESLVWGLVSDLDLVRASIEADDDVTLAQCARGPIVSVEPKTPLRTAGELMLEHHVSHLIVTDPDTQAPLGLVSSLDIAGVFAWGEA